MIVSAQLTPLDEWRQRLGDRRHCRVQPRPLAALGYLTHGPILEGLIELEKLVLVVLYDEPLGGGRPALRLAGYGGSQIPWGVKWGGPENCRFFKDLRLQPVAGARGYRLDLASEELLRLGLRLERELDRHARYRQRQVRKHPQLPKLWAGFRATDVPGITGDGPELAAYAQRTGQSPQHLFKHLRREYFGLSLWPLAWVSHHWEQTVAVFVDLERFPRRQVVATPELPGELSGFQGAAEIDLYGSGFRRPGSRRRRGANCRKVALASA